MNGQGITTVIAWLGAHAGDDRHGCTHAASINDPLELARLFRRIAVERFHSIG